MDTEQLMAEKFRGSSQDRNSFYFSKLEPSEIEQLRTLIRFRLNEAGISVKFSNGERDQGKETEIQAICSSSAGGEVSPKRIEKIYISISREGIMARSAKLVLAAG